MPTRIRFVRWGITLLLSCGCASAWAQRVPSPDDPNALVAETQQTAKRQGLLRTGRITWKCADKLCIATTKKAAVGVNTCQALAEMVGSLSRFGRVARPIPSYDLALCNVRAQIKLAKLEQQRADAEMARARRQSPRSPQDDDVPAPSADASSSAVTAVPGATRQGGSPRLSGPKPLPRSALAGPTEAAPASAAPSATGTATPPAVTTTAPTGSAATPGSRTAPATAQGGPTTAARGSTSTRRPPPVVEASPIAPSYRPPIYAIRVTPLAVVGRGSVAMDAQSPPADGMPGISENEPEQVPSSAAVSSTATEAPTASASEIESAVSDLPGAASSSDTLPPSAVMRRPAATAAATRGAPGSAQTALGGEVSPDAIEPPLPGSARSPSGAARPARSSSTAPVAVPGLAIVGHGRMKEPVQGTHLTVTVDRLEVIGKREGDQ